MSNRNQFACPTIAMLGAVLLVGGFGIVRAGPLEARALYERAKQTKGAPWRRQVVAWQAVLAEATPSDRTYRRALESLARRLRRHGLPHAAAALEAQSAALGAKRDPSRLGAVLILAQGLRREGDLGGATPLIGAVANAARAVSARLADRARELQAEDLAEGGDLAGLEALAGDLARERAAVSLRLEVAGRVGMLRLGAGDVKGARRALEEARRLHEEGMRGADEQEAKRCAKGWLDLELRERVPP